MLWRLPPGYRWFRSKRDERLSFKISLQSCENFEFEVIKVQTNVVCATERGLCDCEWGGGDVRAKLLSVVELWKFFLRHSCDEFVPDHGKLSAIFRDFFFGFVMMINVENGKVMRCCSWRLTFKGSLSFSSSRSCRSNVPESLAATFICIHEIQGLGKLSVHCFCFFKGELRWLKH